MNKLALICLLLGLRSVFAGDIPITGTFRATPEDPAVFIQKLVISANGICDVTYSTMETQRSLKLGKLEQTFKRVNKEARGKVDYSAKVEESLDGVEGAFIKEYGPDSQPTKDIKSKIAVFRNLGYEGVIILKFPTETGAGAAMLIQKGDLLIDLNNGLKLKKAWW